MAGAPTPQPSARALRLGVLALLAATAIFTLARVYAFGQQRFFTIDEYQYGHATWLVSQGLRPYVDFYEHHFPLSYVLHAPLVGGDADFGDRALRLRQIAFAYLLVLAVVLGLTGYRVTRNAYVAWLSGFVPLAFGFSLMSAVDYRADNVGACLFLACLAVVEANRARPGRAGACFAGLLFGVALFSTQKLLTLAAPTIAILLGLELLRGRRAARGPLLAFPGSFVLGTLAVAALVLGAGAALGMLPRAFEITVLQALEHESRYPSQPAAFADFAKPFLVATPLSTAAIVASAAFYLVRGRNLVWAIALAVAVVAGLGVRAKYPYNYVFVCLLVAVLAVRGYALLVDALGARWPRARTWQPLLYLVPLALLPDQLGFVSRASDNREQLGLLRRVQRFSSGEDAVIDGAGAALFRDHGSYYWYHGNFHRLLFAEYFSGPLVEDYRRSRALFWIDDMRQKKLPEPVRDYFRRHYVWADGSLHVLGFATPPTAEEPASLEIDVIRAGDYFVFPEPVGPRRSAEQRARLERMGGLSIDGRPMSGDTIQLAEGRHRLTVAADTPSFIVTPLPRELFGRRIRPPHSRLFEFD